MKIFVAGATGAIGKQLLPMLAGRGHEVVGTTRSTAREAAIRDLGAEPAVVDALDADSVARAVREARPEVVVHELTGLSGGVDPRRMEESFALTNRLRTEGTDNLLAAAQVAGASRFVAQSFAGYLWSSTGGPALAEDQSRDAAAPGAFGAIAGPMQHLEDAVTGADWTTGIVLRYGFFYGPGTSVATNPDGEQVAMVRKRRFPIVGEGAGVWSFIHVEDAAAATVAAIEGDVPAGIYHVTDDEPAPVREWLPGLAEAIGAKRPLRLPHWLGRLGAGADGVAMLNDVKGADNAKAKRALDWQPRYASWRQGFREGLG